MFARISKALWGEVTGEEAKKFGLLSACFFFIVGSYWMLRELKDAIFMSTVGENWLSTAKIVSVCSLVLLVLFYNKMVDLFEKTHLVYIIASVYSLLFLGIAYFLAHPTIGLANTVTGTHRILGWVAYVAIESFASLVVGLFWSYVASVIDPVSAKRGYPLIISGAQCGSMIGSAINIFLVKSWGIPTMFACAAGGVMIVPFMIKFFSSKYSTRGVAGQEEKKSTGVIEGLKLIGTRPYLMGILVVSTVYEIVGTIIDLQFKPLAKAAYGSPEHVAQFFAWFGLCANALSFAFALIGVSFLIRKLGLTACLVIYPLMLAGTVILTGIFPKELWAFFAAMMVVKGLSYALNNPCKDMMYIPTTRDIKFKAKSWIDAQGGRSAKALGGGFDIVSRWLGSTIYGSVFSLGIIAAWIPVAVWVGRTNHKLVQENKIVE